MYFSFLDDTPGDELILYGNENNVPVEINKSKKVICSNMRKKFKKLYNMEMFTK